MASGGNTNGGSYQKYDGSTGTYQEVSTKENGELSTKSGGVKSFLFGAVFVAVLGVGYSYGQQYINIFTNHSDQVVKKSIASSSGVTVDKTGKLKLFDELSKYFSPFCFAWYS
jgi:hypothetical protein